VKERKRSDREFTDFHRVPSLEGVFLRYSRFVSFAYALHSHDDIAVGQTLQGVQVFRCCGSEHRMTPGGIITINPGEIHDGHAGDETGFVYRMIYVPTSLAERVARAVPTDPRRSFLFGSATCDDAALSLLLSAMFETLTDRFASTLEVETAFFRAFGALLRRCGTPGIPAPTKRLPGKIVQDAMTHLRENLGRNSSLEEMAAMFDLSPFSFLRLFQRETGMWPHRFQIQCRVERARDLIEKGRSLAEAALEAGFCDQSHLNRRFREIFGMTPGCYRRSLEV
jgi:AraC-like DNA-binding protein